MNFVRRPCIDLYPGIRVTKDTNLEYKNKKVHQTIDNLVLKTKSTIKGEGFTSVQRTTIQLQEGDVLLFEEESRGYIKPVEGFVSIEEAIDDLTNIRDLGG